jgi:hypothetical protein
MDRDGRRRHRLSRTAAGEVRLVGAGQHRPHSPAAPHPAARGEGDRDPGWMGMLRFNHLQAALRQPGHLPRHPRAVNRRTSCRPSGPGPELWRGESGVYTPGTPIANDEGLGPAAQPARTIERVKRDLARPPAPGRALVLLGRDRPALREAMSEVGADMFRRIGMNLEYQALDWGTPSSSAAPRASRRIAAAGAPSSPSPAASTSPPPPAISACAATARMVGSAGPTAPSWNACATPGSTRRTSPPSRPSPAGSRPVPCRTCR